jgi:hypothetical protein
MRPVKSRELTNAKSEVMPMGLGHVIHFVVAQVHAARCDFMQLGLPNVCAVFIDQGDNCTLVSAIGMSQSGREFQSPSAATHDNDFVLFAHVSARVFVISSVRPFKRRKATAEKHSRRIIFYYFEGKNKTSSGIFKISMKGAISDRLSRLLKLKESAQ